jgi:hypothetical protein
MNTDDLLPNQKMARLLYQIQEMVDKPEVMIYWIGGQKIFGTNINKSTMMVHSYGADIEIDLSATCHEYVKENIECYQECKFDDIAL